MSSFAKDNPKDIKPTLGRTPTDRTPLEVHAKKFHAEESFRDYIREHLGRALDPFALRIERITVHFDDVNGDRKGPDTLCRVVVSLIHDEPVVIEEIGDDARVAFDLAVPRVSRNVQRHIERKSPRSWRGESIKGRGP